MSNLQALVEASPRSLHFRHALAAAFKARRNNVPAPPASLHALWDACHGGVGDLLGKSGVRDALGETRARLFHAPGRDTDAQAVWHESLATAVFASRLAQLRQSSAATAFFAGLLHRAGHALALKILARVELEYRLKLETAGAQDWCAEHSNELLERLVRTWQLSAEAAACTLSWRRLGEFQRVATESAALSFGRICAAELLQPDVYVPGAVERAAADFDLDNDSLNAVRAEAGNIRELLRVLD